jgi:hypothetical protein
MTTNRWANNSSDETIAESEAIAKEAARLGLTPWQLRAKRATPTDLIQDIVRDQLRHNPMQPSSPLGKTGASVEVRQGGWVEPRPLVTPYVDHIDRIAQSFAAEDQAKRVKELRELKGPDDPEAA